MEYDKSIYLDGHEIRVSVDGDRRWVRYDGQIVADVTARVDLGPLVFIEPESTGLATYDILVLRTDTVSIFFGRNGELVYSDDMSIKKRLADKVINHLAG